MPSFVKPLSITAMASALLLTSGLAQSGLMGDLSLPVYGEEGGSRGPVRSLKLVEQPEARELGSHYVKDSSYPHKSSVTYPEGSTNCARVNVPRNFLADFSWAPDEFLVEEELDKTVPAALVYQYLYAVGEPGDKEAADKIFLALLEDAGASEEIKSIAREKIVEDEALTYGETKFYKFNERSTRRPVREVSIRRSVIASKRCEIKEAVDEKTV